MSYSEKTRAAYQEVLQGLKDAGLFKQERFIHSSQAADIEVEFPAGASVRKVINMCANNYLGLSSHPAVVQAAHEGMDARGYGMSSVRFICGTQDIHRDLERKVTEFLGTEDTILFPSCMDANAGVFEAVLAKDDVMISDRLVHASLIDGIRLCGAMQDTYKHADMAHLEQKLEMHQDRRFRMVITDGVFSMDGDTAPLDKMAALCDKYDAMILVDDSHATGFIGRTGRGTHEKYGVVGRMDIITTTFGKALGGATGGCVSGRRELVEMCRQKARPYLFSNSIAPVVVQGILKVFDILMASTERRDKLEKNAAYWRKGLQEAGFVLKEGDTPIVPVMLFNAKLAQDFSRALYEEGIYAVGFFFPVVPQGQARIRTQISAGHEIHHLDKALEAFRKVGKTFDILGRTKQEIIERFGM
ncbi:MAG: glycine C-acetyltransferase [Acidobacteria bacterium]|jgi:glycine C-acetyltransferase|nr:glycine C-acetyltransferase [Acidobacteriota bacterium]OQB58170.1 MAG: 2-amino-3-ketobutyrate coenzyme A ligase [Candidatus Aminicenantes bacterium ADurb.Bin147]HNQ80520.1 glycine C-acetyltransferase [Candidatus Aminicenantes bacterium]MDD8010003.1 glycine C-acetyltransferase [Acidobacteriota bacterium]MDD8029005.1 glycine C-acetyltransferase [Acidobacteriota bacterium]